LKDAEVLRHLEACGVRAGDYRPLKAAPAVHRYRNKMEYSFGDEVKGGEMTLGLHKKGSYMSVLNTTECLLVPESFNRIHLAVLEWARKSGHGFYHKRSHSGFLRSLVLRRGERTGEVLVNLVTTSGEALDAGAFLAALPDLAGAPRGAAGDRIVGVLHTVNDRRSDVVAADSVEVLHGRSHYFEELLGLRFKVGGFTFFQTNTSAVERMFEEAFSFLEGGRGTLYDVYCGTGAISLALSRSAGRVVGIELSGESVAAARENAALNQIGNCEFHAGDALEVMEALSAQGLRPDAIAVDPPRMGLHPKALKKVLSFDLPEILYISCNPKTFAENMAVMQNAGYALGTLGAYDNFPYTRHTELAAHIVKV
jgi:23S rRNA (uracil-5-)-methyltransferase RumA